MPESETALLRAAGKALYIADRQGWDWDQLTPEVQEAWIVVAIKALEDAARDQAHGTMPRFSPGRERL